jgi:hypothetical protein
MWETGGRRILWVRSMVSDCQLNISIQEYNIQLSVTHKLLITKFHLAEVWQTSCETMRMNEVKRRRKPKCIETYISASSRSCWSPRRWIMKKIALRGMACQNSFLCPQLSTKTWSFIFFRKNDANGSLSPYEAYWRTEFQLARIPSFFCHAHDSACDGCPTFLDESVSYRYRQSTFMEDLAKALHTFCSMNENGNRPPQRNFVVCSQSKSHCQRSKEKWSMCERRFEFFRSRVFSSSVDDVA